MTNSVSAVPDFLRDGMDLLQQGRFDEAEKVFARILAQQPDNFDALHLLGALALETGRTQYGVELIGEAIRINAGFAQAHINLGSGLRQLGRAQEALGCFDAALAIAPGSAEALNGRAIVLRELARFDEALADIERARALEPGNARVEFNRGMILLDMRRDEDALVSFEATLAIRPGFAEAYVNAARIHCEKNRVERGLALFRRHGELVYGPQAPPRPEVPPPHKVRHDKEQRDYFGSPIAFHLDGGSRLASPAVNRGNDAGEITRQWQTARPQMVVIDNVLTPEALNALRRFCWDSTVWRKSYDAGYLGALPEHGFACPLLAQIADEFRAVFPAVFCDHPLRYLWGFKFDSTLKGVNIHADFAAVNVNFWITPDDANLDPASGGLIVWNVAAPLDWDFARYNNNETAIREFLARSGATSVTVPYRANRAVIFDSDLFHETDRIAFKEGYLNRRINITMLYGRRKSPDGKLERRV